MLRLIAGKTLSGLIALFIFLALAFVFIETLLPGDQLTILRLGMSASELEALREELGFNRPLLVRFWAWLTDFVTGGFLGSGLSAPRLGTVEVASALAATMFVFATGLILAYFIGSWLGRVTSSRRGIVAGGITFVGIASLALFPPFLAVVLNRFLRRPIFDFRTSVVGSPRDLWADTEMTATQVFVRMTLTLIVASVVAALLIRLVRRRRHRSIPFGIVLLGIAGVWLGLLALQGMAPLAVDLTLESAIPILAFALLAFGEFMLIMKTGMVENQHEDYVLTARAKGLSARRVRDVHVARGATLVLLATLAVSIPYLMAGLVIIERALSFEGMGSLLFGAIENQNMPVVMTSLAVIGLFVLVIRLSLEVLEGVMDPRLRRPEKVPGAES